MPPVQPDAAERLASLLTRPIGWSLLRRRSGQGSAFHTGPVLSGRHQME